METRNQKDVVSRLLWGILDLVKWFMGIKARLLRFGWDQQGAVIEERDFDISL